MIITILALSVTLSPAQAGSRWLSNDGYVDGAKVGFQGGFVAGECWGSVFVPDAGDYPFQVDTVRMMVGGSSSQELFTVEFYNFNGEAWNVGGYLGAESAYITGSDSAWNDLTVSDLKLGLPEVTSGNVGVAVCLEKHGGYPAIGRDTDGMDHGGRNYIYADAGGGANWYQSQLFGLTGDWIMRLCISGDTVSDEGCSDGGGDGGASDGGAGDGGGDGGTDGGGELAISSITPTTVAEGEAVDVVVLGEGFRDSAEARIGGIALVGNDVVSDTTISGRTPTTLPVGVHDVEVVDGDDSVVLAGAFEVTGGGCGCASSSAGGRGLAWLGLLVAPLLAWRRRR